MSNQNNDNQNINDNTQFEEIAEQFETPLDRLINRYTKEPKNGNGDDVKKDTAKTKEVSDKSKEDVKNSPIEDDFSMLTYLDKETIEKYKKRPLDESFRKEFFEVLNNMQKYNKLQSERAARLNELEKLVGDDKNLSIASKFIEEFRQDPVVAISKYAGDLQLPDIEVISENIQKTKDLVGQVELYQKKELIPAIEKKYKLESGTFIYDPSEAYTPGTPSYEYRVLTEKKELQLKEDLVNREKSVNELRQKMEKQRIEHLSKLKETYFPSIPLKEDMSDEEISNVKKINEEREKKFLDMLGKLDEKINSLTDAKKFFSDDNPFTVFNLFRGVYFDELVQEAINKVHQQYREKGMYLDSKEMPTDITKVKEEALNNQNQVFSKEQLEKSPLLRSIYRSIK